MELSFSHGLQPAPGIDRFGDGPEDTVRFAKGAVGVFVQRRGIAPRFLLGCGQGPGMVCCYALGGIEDEPDKEHGDEGD